MAIVSGLAITHMIASLYGLLAHRERVRSDWLALTAAGVVAYVILYGWWVTWAGFHLRMGPLPFWRFLMPLLSVTTLALAARAALPDHVPPGGLNMRLRYDTHGVWIWRALLVSSSINTLGILIRQVTGETFGRSAAPWGVAGLALSVVLFLILGCLRSRRVHAVLAPMLLILLIAATVTQPV